MCRRRPRARERRDRHVATTRRRGHFHGPHASSLRRVGTEWRCVHTWGCVETVYGHTQHKRHASWTLEYDASGLSGDVYTHGVRGDSVWTYKPSDTRATAAGEDRPGRRPRRHSSTLHRSNVRAPRFFFRLPGRRLQGAKGPSTFYARARSRARVALDRGVRGKGRCARGAISAIGDVSQRSAATRA